LLGPVKKCTLYKGNLFGFEMGPSVKFVSAVIDAFSNKKMRVNFFIEKSQTGRAEWVW
jgi:hypothetical protein